MVTAPRFLLIIVREGVSGSLLNCSWSVVIKYSAMSGFQSPITIRQAIERINRNDYLLPSFQREYVWSAPQVEALFDSLMRGYPISSMLFWKVSGDAKRDYRFYSILRYFIERYHIHNDAFPTDQVNDFWAILDGQQRLTSLYLGLCGSYAYKRSRARWQKSEANFPTRHLYLNLSKEFPEDELDKSYDFLFIDKAETQEKDIYVDSAGNKWFRVAKILGFDSNYDIDDFIEDNELNKLERKILKRLERVITVESIINYYEEDTTDPDKAVNIFVRINSGGSPLSFSDILMSIATATWKKDARNEINNLVDQVNDLGFNITRDFVLKAFLVLFHKDVRFRLKSFDNSFINTIETNWEKVRDCILQVFYLLQQFGFNHKTLTSYNAVMPIVFYLYYSGRYSDIVNSVSLKEDREAINKWLHKAILLKSYGGSSDSAISRSRKVMIEDTSEPVIIAKAFNIFPGEEISDVLGHHNVSDEEIHELLLTQKDNAYAFCILSMLYPFMDYKNNNFHLDHMHPASKFDDNDHSWEEHNSILNLQMLDGNENMSKNDGDLDIWVAEKLNEGVDKEQFFKSHLIPANVSLSITDFNVFIKEREKLLTEKLREILA